MGKRTCICFLLVVVLFGGVAWAGPVHKNCDCYFVMTSERTCNIDGCKQTVTVSACGGYPPTNCFNCDPFASLVPCCSQFYGNARSTGPCHYSDAKMFREATRVALRFAPACSGEWLTMEVPVSVEAP